MSLSVVVVAYDMARELPRTLFSLSPAYQRGIAPGDYEVVVVDNGSPQPVDPALLDSFGGDIRLTRVRDARPAPGRAANEAIASARGDFVGLLIDGARIASPGLLARAVQAQRLAPRPVVAALAWHLGGARHDQATAEGYDQHAEDELLGGLDWERDGYRLFGASTLAASSSRGWFGPMGESNALFMPKEMWNALGGFDERFALPGGGLSNHDLFRRACELDRAQLVVLLGEGTFHQMHGGVATSGRITWEEMHAEYVARRGKQWVPPDNERLYLGTIPDSALPHLQHSVEWAVEHPRTTRAPR
jgi:glycosyltransferase involved in cell wall biosynthesis